MFSRMLDDPLWYSERTALDASSGSMGCSIAYLGRVLGIPVRIVSSAKPTTEKRFFIEYFGAAVSTIGAFTIEGNEFCRSEASTEPDQYYFLDQLHNPANPDAHFVSTGPEILEQVRQVSAIVASIGSGGTLLGGGRFLKTIDESIRIIAVEAASGTRIPGTASLVDGDYRTPFIAAGFDEGVFDASVRVTLDEAITTGRELPDIGIFGGVQTAAVIAAARRAAEALDLRGDVVTLSGDTGWKNLDVLSAQLQFGRGMGTLSYPRETRLSR